MRRPLGWLMVVLGIFSSVVGIAAAIVFGPDDAVTSGPHGFRSAGPAIITAPAALAYSGPTLEVRASAAGRPVFVGVATDVDVRDYLDGTAYTRIDTIDVPWSTETSTVSGEGSPDLPPGDLDIWLVSASGDGSALLRLALPDTSIDLVVMDAHLADSFDADLTLSVVQEGVFLTGLALLVGGLGMAAAGWLLQRSAPARGGRPRGSRRPVDPGSTGRPRETEPAEDPR